MPKDQQLEKGSWAFQIGQKDRNIFKKLTIRKIRRTRICDTPLPSKYSGGYAI